MRRFRTARRFIQCRSLALALLLWPQIAVSGVDDAQMKSVYLYQFAMFADWSETGAASDKVNYCVNDNSTVSTSLQTIVNSKPDTANFAALWEDEQPEVCHVLYLENTPEGRVSELKLLFPHALLIGNGESFISDGGMIAFVKANNRIRPLISRSNVRSSGVLLRSQLLDIAILVEEG